LGNKYLINYIFSWKRVF